MLIEFNIENFRSIKEKVTFSMVATKDNSLDGNLINDALKDDKLLKSAVIYGPNASGKTNILLALNFLKLLVLNSHTHQKGQGILFNPFKLDKKQLNKPTRFNIIFIKNSIRYDYTLAFNKEEILEESLYYYPSSKKALIFDRKKGEYKFTIDEIILELFQAKNHYKHHNTFIRNIPHKRMPKLNSPTNIVGNHAVTMNEEWIVIIEKQ